MKRKISVIGLGYVGLPVAVAFGKQERVIGFDINEERISELKGGEDSTMEVKPEELQSADIFFTSDPEDLCGANFHIVAVPTPIDEAKQPNLNPLLKATEMVGRILKPGDIVIYESTVYPGCTEEECVPVLERCSGLKYLFKNTGQEEENLKSAQKQKAETLDGFFLGYSPERINPGDSEHTFTSIKKVVSGSTQEVAEQIAEVYGSVVEAGVHVAPSIKVAEAAKGIENVQRDLNIALVNELALIFNRLGINTKEVLEAAETKWNFLPFRPGLVGGHCIGVDPYYLTYRAQCAGYHPQVILAGRRINDEMGAFVAHQALKHIESAGIVSAGATVTVLGLTFKEDCPDLRNSKVPDILHVLKDYGCKIQVHDPLCNENEALKKYDITLCPLEKLKPASAIILAVAHSSYETWSLEQWQKLLQPKGIIADVKGVVPTRELERFGHLVWKL